MFSLSCQILIYSSKTCLDQKHIDICMNKLRWFRNNFYWLRHAHINSSFPHWTMLCLFDPTVKFQGETFQMFSSGHFRSFFNLRFIYSNQFNHISLWVCDSISYQTHFRLSLLLTGIYYQSIRQLELCLNAPRLWFYLLQIINIYIQHMLHTCRTIFL